MSEKIYDLEERTFNFAKQVRIYARKLTKTIANVEDLRQLLRSSGSVGANYIEANEALSDKDFKFRIKICRKEAKESIYWAQLIKETNNEQDLKALEFIINEATELKKIFSAILNK